MKNYGLILEPIVAEKDYVLGSYGSLGGDVLQPSGQWDAFLPYNESQLDAAGFDAIACATFGTFNAIEMLNRRQYDTERNWSDRFLAKTSGTTPQGNSPHTIAETLRKTGAPNEVDYPYLPTIQTWDQFYADIPQGIFGLATAFSTEFDFKHEYVPTTPAYLKQALQYSPLGISVFAWLKDTTTGLYHKPAGYTDNHWCVLVGYVDGEYWLVYDSYEPQELKKLQWDFAFQIAKRYSLTRHVADEKTWYQHLIELILANFMPPQIPTVPTPANNLLNTFCLAIQKHEGWNWGSRSYRNHNPGNCRYSSVGYDASYGHVGKDADNFAIFSDYETGFRYLKNLVKGKISVHPTQDFYQFFAVYAPAFENDTKHYAEVVAAACNLPPTTSLSVLL